VNEGTNTLTLILDKASSPRRQVIFSSARPPKHIRFNGQVIQAEALVPECLITLPEYKEPASLEILW
jgi:hypothetical protein